MIDLSVLPELPSIPMESQPIVLESLSSSGTVSSQESLEGNSGLNSNEDNSCSNLVVSDPTSLWADKSLTKEEKIWMFAKKIGVTGVASDQDNIEKIKEMEARDKEARSKMETPSLRQ